MLNTMCIKLLMSSVSEGTDVVCPERKLNVNCTITMYTQLLPLSANGKLSSLRCCIDVCT